MATPPGETSLARIFRDADLDLRFFFEHRGNNKAWCTIQANKKLDRWGEWERLEVLKKRGRMTWCCEGTRGRMREEGAGADVSGWGRFRASQEMFNEAAT